MIVETTIGEKKAIIKMVRIKNIMKKSRHIEKKQTKETSSHMINVNTDEL